MDIQGDQITSKSTQKRTYIVVFIVIIAAIIGCYFASQYGFSRRIHRQKFFFERTSIDLSDTDISIYVIGDSSSTPQPDLRGKFWENQLSSIGKNISVQYIADSLIPNTGVNRWIVPTSVPQKGADPGFCQRNIESWTLFSINEKAKRWYFKAQQDTYISIERLLSLISGLDKKVDPMKQAYFQFAGAESPESNQAVFPDASSGWLISNAAVKALFDHMRHFQNACEKFGEEIALSQMIIEMRLEVEEFVNPNFIPTWPNETMEIIGKDDDQVAKNKIPKCPSKQFRFSQGLLQPFAMPGEFIATKMNGVPMNKVGDLLNGIQATDLRIGYPTENKPIFCWR